MSVEQNDWGWLQQWLRAVFESQELSATAKLVMYGLAVHADVDGGSCDPSQATLAKGSSKSERVVRRALKEAEAAGFIKRQRQQVGMSRTSDLYQLTLPPSRS